MGYSCHINSDREISESEIQTIVDNIPNTFKGFICSLGADPKQSWGWSLACDIRLPTGKEVVVSGSYTASGSIAESFINHFVGELKKNGHEITYEMS